MEIQLEYLESPSTDKRRAAQGRILYLLQGELSGVIRLHKCPGARGQSSTCRLLCRDHISRDAAALGHRECSDPEIGRRYIKLGAGSSRCCQAVQLR